MLFCREYHVCGDLTEAQYSELGGDIERGRRVSMQHVCCHCYAASPLQRTRLWRQERIGEAKATYPCANTASKLGYKWLIRGGRQTR